MLTRYRHVVIEDPVETFDPEELAKVEQELGAALPAAFIEFLRAAHGGNVDYIFDAGGEEISLGRVFRVGPSRSDGIGYGTLLGELRKQRQEMHLPPQLLPFAQGGGDVRVYLDLTPEGAGRVVALLEGLPEWTGLRQDTAFLEVASSFDAFLDTLRVDEAGCIDNLRNALASGSKDFITANLEYLDLCLPEWQQKYPQLWAATQSAMMV